MAGRFSALSSSWNPSFTSLLLWATTLVHCSQKSRSKPAQRGSGQVCEKIKHQGVWEAVSGKVERPGGSSVVLKAPSLCLSPEPPPNIPSPSKCADSWGRRWPKDSVNRIILKRGIRRVLWRWELRGSTDHTCVPLNWTEHDAHKCSSLAWSHTGGHRDAPMMPAQRA